MLQWRSKALTLPNSRLLFLQLMRTCVLFLTDEVRTERGPVWNSSSSLRSRSRSLLAPSAALIFDHQSVLSTVHCLNNPSNPVSPIQNRSKS